MTMLTSADLRPLLSAEGIDCFGLLPLSACRVTRGYLLERAGIAPDGGSVIMLALPYRAPGEAGANISRYAIPMDYHHAVVDLFARLTAALSARFPGAKFAGFADHSPIDERHAAAASGLGVLGDHGLIITERYASYVFLAEIVTDLPTDAVPCEIRTCAHCGACRAACPVDLDWQRCLSALTQKKGALTDEEKAAILAHGCAWGCDICQEACPHTRRALAAGTLCAALPCFRTARIPHLTAAMVEGMDDDTFSRRAYAWRGRQTILRNLRLLEGEEKQP